MAVWLSGCALTGSVALLPGFSGQRKHSADQCTSSRRFDYVLDQQAYVAIDNNEPLNEDVINDFLTDPVHQVCEPSALRRVTVKAVCHHSQLLASAFKTASQRN